MYTQILYTLTYELNMSMTVYDIYSIWSNSMPNTIDRIIYFVYGPVFQGSNYLSGNKLPNIIINVFQNSM